MILLDTNVLVGILRGNKKVYRRFLVHVGDMAVILRLVLRYQFASKLYLYLMSNYLVSFDKMDPFYSLETTFGTAIRVAYDSPLGPVSLDLHWNDFSHRLGAYINIGYVF